ncbi:MAG: DUF5320 domain-containing protein [Desulfobacterales bacterium]|nr:DUF5320 domain-containing protein [Desulfobacterales bacterium]
MPGFDKTGPNGYGQMTGRGRGWCLAEVDEKNDFATNQPVNWCGFRRRNRGYFGRRQRITGMGKGFNTNASLTQQMIDQLEKISSRLDVLESSLHQSNEEKGASK